MESNASESIELGLERVMSGFFPRKPAKLILKKKATEQPALKWAGKGLALDEHGMVPKGLNGVKHALAEAYRGMWRGAVTGFCLKGGLSLLFALLGGKITMNKCTSSVFSADVFRFMKFLSAFIGLFRLVNTSCAVFRGVDSPLNSAVGGAVASISLLFDDVERRQGVALYLFVRGWEVYVKQLVRVGVFPYWKYAESFLFGVANMPIMYGFLFEPDLLQRGYYKWILSMGNITDQGLGDTLRVRRDAYFNRGEIIPFRNCSCGYHEGPCTSYCIIDWFRGLLRAGKIYFPVHFLPLLIFRYNAVAKDPQGQILKTGIALLNSCCFLTSYQILVKGSECFLRNNRHVDSSWHALVSGLLTGLSCLFERDSRVSELMLYCMPRGIEAGWNYLTKYGYVKNIKYAEVGFMAVAMGMLTASARADFKLTYHRSLCFLIGS